MRLLKWSCFVLAVLAAAALLVSYSWTFTPIGRMDYGAAVLSKLGSLQRSGDAAITPAYREKLNRDIGRFYRQSAAAKAAIGKQFDVLIPSPEGDIPARVYVPAGEGPFPAMLNIHGGGFFMGNGYVLDAPAIELAARVGMVLVSVDYRLAPEHPFPAALQKAGVPVTLRVVQGAVHGFIGSGRKAERNLALAATLLREHFAESASR
ncbi:MAG: alpha/beta hydrolase [Gammaproteobacteria bacterium]|jgi:acetyl esterase/lipase|nr:alpha/beta hydrolase [Gammaproteobacteria bacterium]MBK9466996.1 alpha/beta hydrolase [Gammaproteobacteria bacterium]MBP6479443.1 alpha/beta hydrolase [Pseudomonadales bacterium]MBP7909605.1 alpha/beta hydrolase [Pseudomonadales bacterium]